MLGIELTNWSVRLALLCYAAVLIGGLAGGGERWRGAARWLWTAGCLMLLAHIGCAFHFVHDWQHALAVDETARRTKELLGWEYGGGVYFNYAFALVWVGDASWWWLAPASYQRRPAWVAVMIHAYLLFIAINGAIVFEDGPTRWFGLAFIALMLIVAARRWAFGSKSFTGES